VSLWKVDDAPTRMHMERLYERLHGEAAGDVSLALQRERSAMVSMLREPHSPVSNIGRHSLCTVGWVLGISALSCGAGPGL